MSEYYGISTPSSDFIAHYGIKGMKWGVRRAIAKGNAKALARHYARARRKLDSLNSNANLETQERRIGRNKKIAGISAGVGVLGTLGAVNQHLKNNKLIDDYHKAKDAHDSTSTYSWYHKKANALYDNNYDLYNQMRDQEKLNMHSYFNAKDQLNDRYDNINTNKVISGAIGAAGFGTAAVAGGRAALAKYRTTKKGHAKAVAKRNAFKNAMSEVFNDPKAQRLGVKEFSTLQKASDASVRRAIKEKLANEKYQAQKIKKQAKRRARLERKIGKI